MAVKEPGGVNPEEVLGPCELAHSWHCLFRLWDPEQVTGFSVTALGLISLTGETHVVSIRLCLG